MTHTTSIMVAEAIRLMESIEEDPPEPFHRGCAKKALDPVINSMRVVGLFYEYSKYTLIPLDTATAQENTPSSLSSNDLRQLHLQYPNKNNNETRSLDLVFKKNHVGNDTSISESPKVFSRYDTQNQDDVIASSFYQNVLNVKALDEKAEPITLVKRNSAKRGVRQTTHSMTVADQSAAEAPNTDQSAPSTFRSLANPGDFLGRCGVTQQPARSSVLQALGYCPGNKPALDLDLDLERKYAQCGMKRPKRTGWKRLLSDRTYSILILMILWANVLRMVQYVFHAFGAPVELVLIPTLWYFMTALTSTVIFVSCTRDDHFLLFFLNWRILFLDPVTRSLGFRGLVSGKYHRYLLVIKWGITVTNMAGCFFIMIMDDSFSGGMNRAFYVTGHRSVASIAVAWLLCFICTCAYAGAPVLIVSLCHLISSHFAEFEEIFRLHVLAAGSKFPKHLRMLRECHLAMCNTVEIMDRFISVACGCLYGVAIVVACFLLYIVVNVRMDLTVTAIVIFWLSSNVLLVAFITYHQATVSTAMHSVSGPLHTIQTSNATHEQLGQMFLTKVNTQTMGFTVFGLITVTKELILTLFGLYITYGVLLLQFKS